MTASSANGALAPCPVVVTVNLDVESVDALAAGAAGLFGRYSYGRYGLREGVWRLLGAFDGAGVKATFFVSADDAERHPDLLRTLAGEGHEIAAQGSVLTEAARTGPAALDAIARARDAIAGIVGEAPRGWRTSNGLMTVEVVREIAAQGFGYDSSFQDDDSPYVFDTGAGGRLVELPVCDYLTDATFYGGRHSHDRVRKVWAEEFEALYAAGGYIPLTLHARGDVGSARPVRARVVADFLHRIKAMPGVRFYRCDELAALVHAGPTPAEPIPDWPLEMPSS